MVPAAPLRSPLVLVAGAGDGLVAQISSGLQSAGCGVLRARAGHEAVERAREIEPDAILIDADLPDMTDLELCRRLRSEPRLAPTTAIVITGALVPSRERRLAAVRAGAWDVLGHPIDVEELVLKLRSYTRATILAQAAQAESLVDPETGLYNLRGLTRRAGELGALAVRAHAALACVVLAPEVDGDRALSEVAACCAQAIKTGIRHSDVAGRVGSAEFAVLAPATEAKGATRLAQRLAGLTRTVSRAAGEGRGEIRVHTGYEAVGNLAYTPMSGVDLLMRARRSWRPPDVESSGA